jgi:Spy/CpxP family protein refolding chaperone
MKILLIFLTILSLSWADHDEDRHHIPKDLGFLELTKEQQPWVLAMLYEYRHKMKAYRHEKKAHRKTAEKLFKEEMFDVQLYEALTLELGKEAVALQADFLKKLHAVLTPEQRERFVKRFEEWEVE